MATNKQQEISFEEIVERGCGLDVHKKEIVATVSGTGIKTETDTVPKSVSEKGEKRANTCVSAQKFVI